MIGFIIGLIVMAVAYPYVSPFFSPIVTKIKSMINKENVDTEVEVPVVEEEKVDTEDKS